MTEPRLDRPADLDLPRVLSRSDALRLGFTRSAIEHRLGLGRWQTVLPHTYLTRDTLVWADRLAAAISYAGDGAVLTGAAALADVGLRSVSRPAQILVLAPRTSTARSRAFVRIRRTTRLPVRADRSGPARAPAARAVADLALELRRIDDVRTLVAQAVRARLCTVDEVRIELLAGPRRGSALLRTALTEVGGGAWSAPEARAARLLRAAGLGPFEQNARIELPTGGYVIVDFLWRELDAILEIDSVEHHLDPVQWRATMDRHLALETLGFAVVHRTPSTVRNEPARFVGEIGAWLAARRSTRS
jgi:very-short-patch-repair endonuclease